MQRARLRDVKLTGLRWWIRAAGFALLLALAVVGFSGYLLPAHSVEGGAWHSNFDDGGGFPLVVFFTYGVIAALLWKRGLGAGIVAGVLAVPAAIASLVPVLLVHMFQHVDHGFGEGMLAVSVIGLLLGGVLVAIVEPILYVLQRRSDERRAQPQLPVARVYA